jgi:hypothetical protein
MEVSYVDWLAKQADPGPEAEVTQQVALPAEREGHGPRLYRCAQGVLFKKKGEDPAKGAIIRQTAKVGHLVRCSGRTWTGEKGGVWAELEETNASAPGDLGWVLVKGPGFGLSGPALVDAAGDGALQPIEVFLLQQDSSGVVWVTMVPKDASIADFKAALCRSTGLAEAHCCLAKDPPSVSPTGIRLVADYMPELPDERRVGALGFQGKGTIFLIYVGDLPTDLEVRPQKLPELPHEEPVLPFGVAPRPPPSAGHGLYAPVAQPPLPLLPYNQKQKFEKQFTTLL